MKILYIGEIVGKAGVFAVKNQLAHIKNEESIDLVIANGDGATGGWGLGKNHAFYLHKLGIQVITSGENIYYKKDIQEVMNQSHFVLRAANFPPTNPGKGWKVLELGGKKVGIVSLLGQSGFSRIHLNNPFSTLDFVLDKIKADVVLVDFHAATTAEKNSFFYHADGKVAAVFGSHQRVPTLDERILPLGTAVITDAGRTGSFLSVGGFTPEKEILKFTTGVFERSEESWAGVELQGVVLHLDDQGKVLEIKRLRKKIQEVPHDSARQGDED